MFQAVWLWGAWMPEFTGQQICAVAVGCHEPRRLTGSSRRAMGRPWGAGLCAHPSRAPLQCCPYLLPASGPPSLAWDPRTRSMGCAGAAARPSWVPGPWRSPAAGWYTSRAAGNGAGVRAGSASGGHPRQPASLLVQRGPGLAPRTRRPPSQPPRRGQPEARSWGSSPKPGGSSGPQSFQEGAAVCLGWGRQGWAAVTRGDTSPPTQDPPEKGRTGPRDHGTWGAVVYPSTPYVCMRACAYGHVGLCPCMLSSAAVRPRLTLAV